MNKITTTLRLIRNTEFSCRLAKYHASDVYSIRYLIYCYRNLLERLQRKVWKIKVKVL